MYNENYKMLLKEIIDNTNKYKDISVHGLEDNAVKLSLLSKVIYRFPTQNPNNSLCRNRKMHS